MLGWLTEVADFMPHGMCLLWRPGLMALHMVSDGLIAVAYFAIPFAIAVFVRRRADLNVQHKAIALLFAVFIAACGLTHVMSIVVLWLPYYDLEGLIKAFTALVSVATALALPFLLPQLLRIPSPRVLAAEIAAHRVTLASLETARAQLAAKVADTQSDLAATTRRFEAALRGSQVSVSEQDSNLRYTWVYNPALDIAAQSMIGRRPDELYEAVGATAVQDLMHRVLATGEPARAELRLSTPSATAWLDVRAEPIGLDADRLGLIATATDITALKDQEEVLRIVMRELNHRSKNLLAIVMSLARQTARGAAVPDSFLVRLQERLTSLANAHDALVRENWKGADITDVVDGQLRHQIEAYAGRIHVVGESCLLPAEAAQYLGMALHELGSNAVKHGALSGDAGSVTLAWREEWAGSDRRLVIEWSETGGPQVSRPSRFGFGSTILTELAPRALHGTAALEFLASGLRWTLTAPLVADPEEGAQP